VGSTCGQSCFYYHIIEILKHFVLTTAELFLDARTCRCARCDRFEIPAHMFSTCKKFPTPYAKAAATAERNTKAGTQTGRQVSR
jgi:hypothetical protein